MGDVVIKKLRRMAIGIGLIMCCMMGLIVAYFVNEDKKPLDEKMVRIEINSFLYELEKTGEFVEFTDLPNVSYTAFDLEGKVLYSENPRFIKGEYAELHNLGNKNQYIVPYMRNGQAAGILLFDCSKISENEHSAIGIAVIVCALIILMIGFVLLYRAGSKLKKDIIEPVNQLHEATKSIANGNFEEKIIYDYEGEIGSLCHDFEIMRDELRTGKQREQTWKEKEQTLYASLSHDINTPLAVLRGYLEEIRYGVVSKPEEVNNVLDISLRKIDTLSKLVGDIIEHSKAELNQLSITRKEVYTREYFERILDEYNTDLEIQGIKLVYNLPENIILNIDEKRIRQVIQNLVSNAVKYGGDNLIITFKFTVQDDKFIVSIKDNGNGIAATDLPHIFELFYRGNKARTQDIPGSGLGLHITKYIIEHHGGQIECDSILGHGTEFQFYLPL